jgi:hypothetical protein
MTLQDTIDERIEVLAKVRDEIRTLRTTLTNIEEFEVELESQVKQLQSISAKEQEPKFSGIFQRYRNIEKVHAAEQERRPKAVRDTAYEVLKRNNQPIWVHYSELKRQVEAEGVHIGGQRPDDNFMNHLSQDERFIRRNGRSTWSLKEWFPHLNSHDEVEQRELKTGT